MGAESNINQALNKTPQLRKFIKRTYQLGMYAVSPKIKHEGKSMRVSPDDGKEYFFGYYDKSPWDISGRYMLCLKAKDTWSDVSPKQVAEILLIDTFDGNKTSVIATTHTWNVQQGCMLQWLGPDFSSRIIYNDFRDGQYVSVIHTISTGEEKVILFPVYAVAADGEFALSLDFSRLYRLRPGYGYYNVSEETANEKVPDSTCIWKIDLMSGEIKSLLKYTDFANFEPREEMNGAEHKVNHIMLNPSGERFMVLHRWFQGSRKYTRLVTCNIDGTDMYNLSDDNMVSHCCWKNDNEIFAFENKNISGNGYYLMKDKTQEYEQFWPGIDYDGHPSYSPDGSKIVFDRYPDKARIAAVMLSAANNQNAAQVTTLAKVFAPFKYDNDTRCDLHPRWSRDGKKIAFDGAFEGHRGLYVVDVEVESDFKISVAMCTYNGSRFLFQQLDSILSQTLCPDQIVIIDDASQDNTWNIIEQYSQEHSEVEFVIKKNNKNVGYIANFLNAVRAADGDIIFLADQDDVWYQTKISDVVNVFEMHEDALAVNCAYDLIDADGKKIVNKLSVRQGNTGEIKKVSWRKFILSPRYPGMSLAIKKDLIDYLPGMSSDMIPAHDWMLNQTAAYKDGLFSYEKILAGYRQHDSNSVGAIKGNTKCQLMENRIRVIRFYSKTHNALKRIYPDDLSIQNWVNKLMNLDELRIRNIENKHVIQCIFMYLSHFRYMTRRCFMGDFYTILRLRRK